MTQRLRAVLNAAGALGFFGGCQCGRRGLSNGECGDPRGDLARVRLNFDGHLLLYWPFVVFLVDDKLDGLGFRLADFGLNGPERCLFGACRARRKEDVRGGRERRSLSTPGLVTGISVDQRREKSKETRLRSRNGHNRCP